MGSAALRSEQKFVYWVVGVECKFSVSFGQNLDFAFGFGPSWTKMMSTAIVLPFRTKTYMFGLRWINKYSEMYAFYK